jgi:NAD-dependent SIR2 family protein deacetylase
MRITVASAAAAELRTFVSSSTCLLCLTGAGISTESGIPDYRSPDGSYSKGHVPMTHQQFVGSAEYRQRYWARSSIGYAAFSKARPNSGHYALARGVADGLVDTIVTQNVDGLHTAAGASDVVDLHGRTDRVVCLDCGALSSRRALQRALTVMNADWYAEQTGGGLDRARLRADGDADVTSDALRDFAVPPCRRCGGTLKPDVVYFGDNVPRERRAVADAALDACDGLLVVGSSMEVFSGYRFALRAAERGVPIAILNSGETRVDRKIPEAVSLRIDARIGEVLGGVF